MKEISLHILDIVQNSIHAEASQVQIDINELVHNDKLILSVTDNGYGMDEEKLKNVLDPFFTTKNKKTGLGIPLLRQHAEQTGGGLIIESEPGRGTKIEAVFGLAHLDRQPMGNISETMTSLIRMNSGIRFIYTHRVDDKNFVLDTREIEKELEGLSIGSPEIIGFLKDMIKENLTEIGAS